MAALTDQLLGAGVWMALLTAKATVLLMLSLAASHLLRNHSARTRHSLWTVTFAALAALPLLQAGLPGLPVPGLGWADRLSSIAATTTEQTRPGPSTAAGPVGIAELASAGRTPAAPSFIARIETEGSAGASGSATPGPERRAPKIAPAATAARLPLVRSAVAALVALWLAGTGAIGALLGLAMWKARRIAGRAPLVRHPGWHRDYDTVRGELGMRRAVALRVSDAVDTPMAGGVLAPFVLLPRGALSWPTARRLVVLRHELTHVREFDPLRALTARVAAALYWFHPLVWIAGRDAVLARESACDETVVELGTRPSLYATVLLEMAGSAGRSPIPAMVLPMIQRSLLETRLMSILKSDRPRGGRRLLLATVAAASLAALSVAAAVPQEEAVQEEGPPKVRVEKVRPAPRVIVEPKVRVETVAPEPTVIVEPKVRVEKVEPAPALAPSPTFAQDDPEACVWDRDGSGRFHGSMSISGDGEHRVREAVGYRDGDRIIRKLVDGVTICLSSLGPVTFRDDMREIESIAPGGRVLLATVDGDEIVEMEITGLSSQQVRWTVNGGPRAIDAEATAWRDSLMEVIAHQWHISTLRGEASSLRGEISSVRGRMSSLRGELSSVRGEASAVRGRMSSVRGQESSLRGEISSLRGQVSSMRGEVSSHRGAISSLRAQQYRASISESQSIDDRIAEHEAAIEAIEQRIEEFDLQSKVEAIERQIEAMDTDGQIDELERQLGQLEVGERMEEIQGRIEAYEVESEREIERLQRQLEQLDVESSVAEILPQLEEAVVRLQRALQQIR